MTTKIWQVESFGQKTALFIVAIVLLAIGMALLFFGIVGFVQMATTEIWQALGVITAGIFICILSFGLLSIMPRQPLDD